MKNDQTRRKALKEGVSQGKSHSEFISESQHIEYLTYKDPEINPG